MRRVEDANSVREASRTALQLLTVKDFTVSRLREKLARRGFTDEAVSGAVAYVERFGYLDDTRFAAEYARGKMTSRSRKRIAHDLYGKGIERDTVDRVLRTIFEDGAAEREAIRNLLRKKRYDKDAPEDLNASQKIKERLIRQGFPPGMVTEVMRETSCQSGG